MKHMKRTLFLGLGVFVLGLLFAVPTSAKQLFFDNMESGTGNWTATGFWQLQTDPQDISVSSDLNPKLISLPDAGYLPYSYSGESVWWYGEDGTGTFIGDYTAGYQTNKNGGMSDSSNSGYLTSPAVDLSNSKNSTLTFWTWWEIEGVDVDRYDMMYVQATTDGSSWDTLGSINPINDVDGESYKPYSSGGLGQQGQWVRHTFSLDDYVGNESAQVRFYFDTVDHRYNAFRGWMIDNVRITNQKSNKKPSFSSSATGKQSCEGLWGSTLEGGIFELLTGQTVDIELTESDGYWITVYGTGNVVAQDTKEGSVYLPAGKYAAFPNLLDGCPFSFPAYVTVRYNKAAPTPSVAQSDGSIIINGSNFNSNSTVIFSGPKAMGSISAAALTQTEAEEFSVISTNQIEVTLPDLAEGDYHIIVRNGDAGETGTKKKKLKNALTITSDAAPAISTVEYSSLTNATSVELTITGENFADGAVVTVGTFPCKNVEVSKDGVTITCDTATGTSPGFQNVVVQNSDGQLATLIGGVYVEDATDDTYEPSGETLYPEVKVQKFKKRTVKKKKAKFSWKKRKMAKKYQIEIALRDGSHIRYKLFKKKKKKGWVKGLKPGTKYKARIRLINAAGYSGPWSGWRKFVTEL